MWNRFDYSRKLIGMTLIATLLALYFVNGGRNIFMIIGGFLLLEHYFIWDRWDAYDILLGHEWWGFYLISVVYLYSGMPWSFLLTAAGFLFGATYNYFNPFKSFMGTIKELWRFK